MKRIEQLNIRQRPFITALFYYSDIFIDPALRIYGDIRMALHLYLKHEGYKNIVFYSTQYGPTSFEKQMLVNFLPPNLSRSNTQTDSQGAAPQRSTFRRANQNTTQSNQQTPLEPPFDDRINRFTRPRSNRTHDHGREYGDRDSNMLQMGFALTRLSNSVLIIEVNYNEAECNPPVSSQFYRTIEDISNQYRENCDNSSQNRVIVLMHLDNVNSNAIDDLFKDIRIKSIFMTSRDFVSLWRETMPEFDDIQKPADNQGNLTKRLSTHSFHLPAPKPMDIERIIEKEHLQYPEVLIDWPHLDELSQQLSLLATVVGDNQHTLECIRRLIKVFVNVNKESSIGFNTFKSLETRRMKLEPKGNKQIELDQLIGLQSVKNKIRTIQAQILLDHKRGKDTLGEYGNHMIFIGNPGTGKTTVARIVAEIMKDLGLISKGQLIEVNAEDLIAGYVGQTALKTSEVIDSAMGGVLFVDEAYRLAEGGSRQFGAEAVNTLLARMENDRKDLIVIFAGYEENMKSLYRINPGLKRRIRHSVYFDDYSAEELKKIFKMMAQKQSYVITEEVDRMLTDMMEYAVEYKKQKTDEVRAHNAQRINSNNPHEPDNQRIETYNFGNGGWVRNVLADVDGNVAQRSLVNPDIDSTILTLDDFRNLPDIEELQGFIPGKTTARQLDNRSAIERLNELTGLQSIKEYVQRLQKSVEYQQNAPEGTINDLGSQHIILYGNPGTGKSTVARLLAEIFHEIGILPNRNIVETKKEQLVVGFKGQTAPNVAQRVQSALGGVLFIDEAYTLNDDLGKEALDTLLSYLENNRNNLVVILAGYENQMQTVIAQNPGLFGQFPQANQITLPDYTPEELFEITVSNIEKRGYSLTDEAKTVLSQFIDRPQPYNARWARELAENILSAHRIANVKNANYTKDIVVQEVEEGANLMKNNTNRIN